MALVAALRGFAAGGALGAALFVYHQHFKKPRKVAPWPNGIQKDSLWGPSFSDSEIESVLKAANASYRKMTREEILENTAQAIASEKVIGWFQGRMEFGPRALGARSILGDPRSTKMQSIMNLKIKFRESFRPFAPSILAERSSEYFDLDVESPYMMLVAPVQPKKRTTETVSQNETAKGLEKLYVVRSEIPAVTHVDYSARVQTVS